MLRPTKPKQHVLENIIPVRRVTGVQFGILSPEEIKQMSYVNITVKSSIESGILKENSAYDPRLGVVSSDLHCSTCDLDSNRDPGHFGHIDLMLPVINPEFIKKVLDILGCICFQCGALQVPQKTQEAIRKRPKERRLARCEAIANRIHQCEQCKSTIKPVYTQDRINIFLIHARLENKIITMRAERIAYLFSRLRDYEIETLGFDPKYSRPEWMIIKYLPVPPPSIRPVVNTLKHKRAEENLFKIYSQIIRFNESLMKQINKLKEPLPPVTDATAQYPDTVQKVYESLAYYVFALMNDSLSKRDGKIIYQKTSKQLKSIKELMKSKEGLIRGNILGKRVDYTARTVISPDVNFDIDQLGVPYLIAKKLTVPEYVTEENIDRLKQAIMNGNDKYPGAYSVHKARTNATILLLKNSALLKEKTINELEIGDMVRRHLIDNDLVMLNRQPSLHKYSYTGFRIKVLPEGNNTFRFNTADVSGFNADFDGDEMNIKVPQSITTRNEVEQLTLIRRHFVSAGNSETLISPIQDNILGTFLISKNGNQEIDKQQFMHLIAAAKYFDMNRLENKPKYRLIETIELLLPATFSIDAPGGIRIRNGKFIPQIKDEQKKAKDKKTNLQFMRQLAALQEKLLEGDIWKHDDAIANLSVQLEYNGLTKKSLRYIIKHLFNYYGPDATNNFVTGIQRLTNRFLMLYGSSCGISDIYVPQEVKNTLMKRINEAQKGIYEIVEKFGHDKVTIPLTKNTIDFYEELIKSTIGKSLKENNDTLQQYLNSIEWNNLSNMIMSGSKGDILNLMQIADTVGQQSILGKRIALEYGDRSLPHYPKFVDYPESRGFIVNSFLDGLNSIECFHHFGAARIGLMDTSLKTSDSGYINRKMIHFMEDIVIQYDYTLRRGDMRIISFLNGANGFDTTNLFETELELFTMNDEKFIDSFV